MVYPGDLNNTVEWHLTDYLSSEIEYKSTKTKTCGSTFCEYSYILNFLQN